MHKPMNEIDKKAIDEIRQIMVQMQETRERMNVIALKLLSKYELTERETVINTGRY